MRHGSVFRSLYLLGKNIIQSESFNPSIPANKSFLVSYLKGTGEKPNRLLSISTVAIFFVFRICVWDVLGSVSCVSPDLAI